MISISKALQILQKHCTSAPIITIQLKDALHYHLAKKVVSEINMPPFNQSAMDGYALCLHDHNTYHIIDEVKAGDTHEPILQKGEAIRIFTGAPVPKTANAVIMQEQVVITHQSLKVQNKIKLNQSIRPLGEQIKKGKNALQKGTKLTAAGIGYLASLGVTEISVYQKPSIAIVTTGNELITAGEPLSYGKIYESNSIMLETALHSIQHTNTNTYNVKDDYQNTYNLLKKVIQNHDLVLISGGISVGDYDYVGKALLENGVQQIFYKVNQKPGKPLFFGKKENTIIFALPGNPAAALSCFYIYVHTALQHVAGAIDYNLPITNSISKTAFIKKGNRPQFLKAIVKNNTVEILEGQSSAMQHTFALANALVYMDDDCQEIKTGDAVSIIQLPNS